MKGLEPPRLSALDPKSSAATNYATSAVNGPFRGCKYTIFFKWRSMGLFLLFFEGKNGHFFAYNDPTSASVEARDLG